MPLRAGCRFTQHARTTGQGQPDAIVARLFVGRSGLFQFRALMAQIRYERHSFTASMLTVIFYCCFLTAHLVPVQRVLRTLSPTPTNDDHLIWRWRAPLRLASLPSSEYKSSISERSPRLSGPKWIARRAAVGISLDPSGRRAVGAAVERRQLWRAVLTT